MAELQGERQPANAGCLSGAGNVTRTHDLLITNQLLYQLSYASKNILDFQRFEEPQQLIL